MNPGIGHAGTCAYCKKPTETGALCDPCAERLSEEYRKSEIETLTERVIEADAEIARLRDDCADWEAKYMGLRARVEDARAEGYRAAKDAIARHLHAEGEGLCSLILPDETFGAAAARYARGRELIEAAKMVHALADKEPREGAKGE